MNNNINKLSCWYSRTSMARTLMAHSPGLAKTINTVPTGHSMHNLPWMAGTTLGYNYFSWSQACSSPKLV